MRLRTSSPRSWRIGVAALAAGALALSLAACGSSSDSQSGSTDDPNAEILVWADATRQPAFDAFKKAHPEVKLKVELVDPGAVLTKIQLANRVGKGWPDVIFDSSPNEVAPLASPLFNYAQPLNDLVPKDVQDGFLTGLKGCTIDGKLYCLQNDIAQGVLWYNKPVLEQFGYALPTTWAEYEALGEKIAKEHPGYLVGAAGSATVWSEYLWASGCPLASVQSSTQVQINAKDPKCTRVTEMLDKMLANGSVSRLSPWDPETSKAAKAGKLVMMPAPSWFGDFVFKSKTNYDVPAGQIAVAPMPKWDGESTNFSGAGGGGIYIVSSHAKNKKGSVAVAQWVATNDAYQATAPTYPAYGPAAKAWLTKVAADKYYAEDTTKVLTDAASKINPVVSPTRYDIVGVFNSTVVAAITAGKPMTPTLEALQTQLSALAASTGYEVTQ